MKTNAILFAFFAASASLAVAAEDVAQHPTAGAHGGRDHAATAGANGMGGMGRPTAWTGYPTLKTRMSGENRETMIISIVPQNIVAGSIDAYSNNLKDEKAHRQLPMGMGGAKLDKPSTGGFELLTAREEQADTVHVASTVYYFGERGAKNPTGMFMQQKNELEIIPQPYPREHSRYRANEDWKFLVRFNSQPLANRKVNLETSNGSKSELLTDVEGVLNLHVPDDFKPVEEKKSAGGHDHGVRRSADFVLAAEHVEGGKTYLTAFNSSYGADAFEQRNLALGLGFTLLGMLGAVPLLKSRNIKETSEEVRNA